MNAALLNRLRQIKIEELLDPEELGDLNTREDIHTIADLVISYMTVWWERIEKLGLSDRIVWRLKHWLEVEKIGDLYEHNYREILLVPGIGRKSLEEIEQALKKRKYPSLPK